MKQKKNRSFLLHFCYIFVVIISTLINVDYLLAVMIISLLINDDDQRSSNDKFCLFCLFLILFLCTIWRLWFLIFYIHVCLYIHRYIYAWFPEINDDFHLLDNNNNYDYFICGRITIIITKYL